MSKTKISNGKKIHIFNRDGNRCLWCGRSVVDGIRLEVDHVVPEHFGGSSDFDNLGTLCNLCNNGKGGEYYGDYLLSTIFKVRDIWNRIKIVTKDDPGIGTWYHLILSFYQPFGEGYEESKITHKYLIDDTFLISKSTSSEICVSEKKEKALLEFKNIVKDFLFEHKGFFELLDDRLIFRKFKEK